MDFDQPTAPLPLRRRLLLGSQQVMYWSGAVSLYVRARSIHGAIILMYHSVPPRDHARWIHPCNRVVPETFEAQMRFLARRRRVTSMAELVDQLSAGQRPKLGTVVITFDDGYLDTRDVAAPILERYQFPATLYLPTGYVQRGETQWADRLYTTFASRTRDRFSLSDYDASCAVDAQSFEQTAEKLLTASYETREKLLEHLADQLKPAAQPPRLTMTWDDVRDMKMRYPLFDIGGHTVDHIDLRTHGGDAARTEIQGCFNDIRRELGEPPRHFSFPYSRSSDETQWMVEEAGFSSAVAAGSNPLIDAGANRFALPRIEPPCSMSLFRFRTSGAYPGLSLALTGRA